MADAERLLTELTQIQSEIRYLEIEQAQLQSAEDLSATYRGVASNQAIGGRVPTYRPTSSSSAPAGQFLVVGEAGNFSEIPWGGAPANAGPVRYEPTPCANRADCLDENFCYSWSDCGPCEWCENFKCVTRDKERGCSASWECPCPNGDLPFQCSFGKCRQTCNTDNDCDSGEVCGLLDGLCGPGCETDDQCNPNSFRAVGDAKTGSLCLDGSCTFPCEPPVLCSGDNDCRPDQYCAERKVRAQGDPIFGAGYACATGCRDDSSCDRAAGETCVDHRCEKICSSDSNCKAGEVCNSGRCSRVGSICVSNSDCKGGEFCDGDGRCQNGCRSTSDCDAGAGETCSGGKCLTLCSDSSDCAAGEACLNGTCAYAKVGAGKPIDDRFGCGCGEACMSSGQCAPAACISDSDCESCSFCVQGQCLPGCDRENPCPGGKACGPEGECVSTCTNDADCDGSKVCLKGGICGLACEPVVPCISKADCGQGSYCSREGICASGCGVDADCPLGEVCKNGRCETPCLTDGDCGSGRVCADGACRPEEKTCANDDACDPGQICRSGKCLSGCRSDSQCDQDERCVENRCSYACVVDQDCVATNKGTTCVSGACQTVSGEQPGDGGRQGCERWERCDELGRCAPIPCTSEAECKQQGAGTCLGDGHCGECGSDTDCPENRICESGICQYQCVPEIPCQEGGEPCPDGFFCSGGQCAEGCSSDSECPGQTCRDGNCETSCLSDTDCGSTEQCLAGTCRFVGDRCSNDFDCDPEEFCNKGVCSPDNRCFASSDCGAGETCGQAGFCTARACDSDDDCSASEVCARGTCRRVNGTRCSKDGDCGGDEFCKAGVCTADNRCFTSSDCDQGKTCRAGTCETPCTGSADCSPGEACRSGFCRPEKVPCSSDLNCAAGEVCGDDRFCIAAQLDASRLGCPDCSTTCGADHCCHPVKCGSASDCKCGFCNSRGLCQETCLSDSECPAGGSCNEGTCVECNSSPDCWARYGKIDMVCRDGSCETPCSTGTSTGSCYEGLALGDACENCANRCPLDSTCREVDRVCGVSEYFDTTLGRKVSRPVLCKICAKSCSSSASCGEGSICVGGLCEKSDGRCESAGDCAELGVADGKVYDCLRNKCVVRGENCFTGSDCAAGEVCDSGVCKTGNCGPDNPCQRGKTCVDNSCVWTCGGPPLSCSDLQACPPGMTCSSGVCVRPGFVGVGDVLCPFGETCCDGACVTLTPGSDRECSGSCGCATGQECKLGRCVSSSASAAADKTPADPQEQEQDPCQAKGQCCGSDGFCAPCACSEEHPCPAGFCCEGSTGQCVSKALHPATKYGAPGDCTYGPTFCEVLLPGGSAINPSNAFEDPTYPGCEVTRDAAGKRKVTCWLGKPLGPEQIRARLLRACTTPATEPEPKSKTEGQRECYSNKDCGSCMDCETYWVSNDATNGAASTITTSPDEGGGFGQRTEVDGALYSKCRARTNPEASCQCEEDSDCGSCEKCERSLDGVGGFCVAKCAELCPCGGELSSGGKCPTCEEIYGRCAKGVTIQTAPERAASDGRLVPAKTACACAVRRENACCEAYRTLESITEGQLSSGCIEKTLVTASGRTSWEQAASCLDFEKGLCAECVRDDQCPGVQTCKGGVCVGDCGGENSAPPEGVDCSCCSEAGQCRGENESWIESDKIGKGPWTVTVATANPSEPFRTFTESEPDYQTARWIVDSYPWVERIVAMEPGSFDSRCRPCTCTENGIDCKPYQDCASSCYQWVREGSDDAYARDAERIRVSVQLQEVRRTIANKAEQVDFWEKETSDAEALVAVLQGQVNLGAPGAEQQLAAAQQRLATAAAKLSNVSGELGGQKALALSLQEALANLSRAPAGWRQVRVCDCCVDGVCRPEDECTYGTCYTCVEKYGGGFSAALYGRVLENETCITGGAAGRQYYTAEVGQCVKYPCSESVTIEDRYGKITNERYYEYCTGSIIACFRDFNESNWKQGWKFYWNLANSGTFIGGIQIMFPPAVNLYSECLYPNPNAFVGGNTLPMFVDAVATHPCCNKSDLIYECAPNQPGCQIRLETLFEAGDPTFIIRRLAREIQALQDYKATLLSVDGQLRQLKTDNEEAIAALTAEIADSRQQLAEALASLAEDRELLASREAKLGESLTLQDDLAGRLQTAIETRNTLSKQISDLVTSRNAAQEDLDSQMADLVVITGNRSSAASTLQATTLQLYDLRATLAQKRQLLAVLDPQSVGHFNLSQEIATLEQEEATLQSQVESLTSAVNDWTTQANTVSASVAAAAAALKEILDQIEYEEPFLAASAFSVGVAQGKLNDQVAVSTGLSASILNLRETIRGKENLVTSLNDRIDKVLPSLIADRRTTVSTAAASIASITAEVQKLTQEIAKKQEEVNRLSAYAPPTGIVGPVPRPSKAITAKEFAELAKKNNQGPLGPKSKNFFNP